MSNQTIVQEVKHLLSTGQRASISTKTFEKIIELLEQKEKALDEIENYIRENSDFDKSDKLTSDTGAFDILDIINKVKAEYEV